MEREHPGAGPMTADWRIRMLTVPVSASIRTRSPHARGLIFLALQAASRAMGTSSSSSC